MKHDLEALTAKFAQLASEDKFKYTDLWLDDGKSIHGGLSGKDDGHEFYLPEYKLCPLELKVDDEPGPEGGIKILGYGSTRTKDLENDIILPTAFESSRKAFLDDGGKMLFMHDWWALGIGKWHSATIDDKGLFLEGEVLPTTMGKDLAILIRAEVIKTLSIGFWTIESEMQHETDVRTITDLKLLEVSIVNMPANPEAIFSMAKELNLKSFTRTVPRTKTTKGNSMSRETELFKKVDLMTKDFDEAEGTIQTQLSSIKKDMNRLSKTFTETVEKAKDALDLDSIVTDADFKTYCEARQEELTELSESVQKLTIAKKEDAVIKYPVTNWRALLTGKIFLRDENGKALPEQFQTAYKFFNLPMDYDKTPDGQLIKACRNLNDACIIMDAYYRGQKSRGYDNMRQLGVFKTLQEVIEYLESKAGHSPGTGPLTKAMSAGVAGEGLEWIPSLLSAEMDTLFRLTPTVVNFIRPVWQMPSNTAKWPIMTGAAVAYLADEAQTNNPKVLTKSKLATASITFDVRTLAAAIPVSKVMLEDTIIDLVPVIREELVTALATGEEDAIINGDDSATHFDTGLSLVTGDDDVRVAWKGLRKLAAALSNTWDTQSTTLGGGTAPFTAGDVRYNRELLGVLGVDPSQCLHIISIVGYFKMLAFTEVTKANEFGFASTWLSGTLPALDGVEIYISPKFNSNLNASGIFDDSTTDNSAIITLHKNSFMPGERRGVTLEFELNIDTQQWLFVATQRRDFQNMRPSSQFPVAVGFNINN